MTDHALIGIALALIVILLGCLWWLLELVLALKRRMDAHLISYRVHAAMPAEVVHGKDPGP